MLHVVYFWFTKFDAKWFDSSTLNAEVVFLDIIEMGWLFHSFVVVGKNEFA